MRVSDADELKYLFGWAKPIDVEDLAGQGYGLLGDGQGEPRPMRVFRMKPSTIDRIAVECGKTGRRPGLEPGILSTKTQKIYDARYEDQPEKHEPAHSAPRSTSATVTNATRSVHDTAARLRAQAEALKAERTNPAAKEVADLEHLWNLPVTEPEAPEPVQDSATAADERARALEILRDAGPEGTGSTRIAAQLRTEGYKTVRQTVAGWLAEELIKGTVEQPGGSGKPYVWKQPLA
jgi:hypothetical protein